ncbi:hypothetical protein JKG47_02900 [Acidithiobacillus sp. MC6.1]|nr:hypothetical protein [Acidithiobacillus sp. MC6.1]
MRQKQGMLLCMAALGALAQGAQAASLQECPENLGPAQQVSCLQIENQILQQQLQNAHLHKSIAKLAGNGKGVRHLSLPKVLSTYGTKHIQAVLEWTNAEGKPSGSMLARVGDVIPGGWKVQSIGSGVVVVRNGVETHTLMMSFGVASHGNSGFNMGAAGQSDTAMQSVGTSSGAPVSGAIINRKFP